MENKMLPLLLDDNQNEELINAHVAVKNFFECYSKEDIKNRLWEFYKGYMFYCEQWVGGENCFRDLAFYEDLKDILEDCNILQNNITAQMINIDLSQIELFKCPENLKDLVNLIVKVIPTEYIFCFKKADNLLDLMIILDKSCVKSFADIEPLLEFATLGFSNIHCSLHSYGRLSELFELGNVFYNKACIAANLIYRKTGSKPIPDISDEINEEVKQRTQSLFDASMGKANQFYKGAKQFMTDGHCSMTAFMLHQACELSYRTLLMVLRGKDIKSHSPAVLRKHLQRFAPEIIGVFSEDEEIEIQTLNLMEEAYLKSRYEPDYTVEWSVLNYWYERVGVLQQKAVEIVSAYW